MTTYTPHLYIGIGETGAYFTLRETYLHERYTREGVIREVRSFHHFNLSQDADEAFNKAKVYADANLIKLNTTREQMVAEMRDIQRANAEEMQARVERQKAREAEWEAEREARKLEQLDKIAEGVFPFGNWAGKKFEEAPRGYLTWLVDKRAEFEEGSMIRLVSEAVERNCGHLLLPKPDPDLHVGEPKKRMVFDVTVVRSAYFDRSDFSGYGMERVYVTTMVEKQTGACLVAMTSSWGAEEGEELIIKATVKEHSEYKGQAQTLVQRVCEVQSKAKLKG